MFGDGKACRTAASGLVVTPVAGNVRCSVAAALRMHRKANPDHPRSVHSAGGFALIAFRLEMSRCYLVWREEVQEAIAPRECSLQSGFCVPINVVREQAIVLPFVALNTDLPPHRVSGFDAEDILVLWKGLGSHDGGWLVTWGACRAGGIDTVTRGA